MKLTDLPSDETLTIFTSPSSTPTQCSAGSPLRQTNPPAVSYGFLPSVRAGRRRNCLMRDSHHVFASEDHSRVCHQRSRREFLCDWHCMLQRAQITVAWPTALTPCAP